MTKLKKPARVGNTIFHVGVDERQVIFRAQREYEYRKDEPTDEGQKAIQDFLREVHDRRMPGYSRIRARQRVALFGAAVREAKRRTKREKR